MITENVLTKNYSTTVFKEHYSDIDPLPRYLAKFDIKGKSKYYVDLEDSNLMTFLTEGRMNQKLWNVKTSSINRDEKENKITLLVYELEQQLYRALVSSNRERDSLSSAEQLVIQISEKYSFRILGEVVQNIYMDYNDYPSVLVDLCGTLERFDSAEVVPWGPVMLVGLLGHKSDSVKEAASVLIENWATVSLLPMLRNIEVNAKWLKEYINSVVQYLEGCEKNVLCQEVG